MEKIASNKVFGGEQLRYQHDSDALSCEMTFSIYLPPQVNTPEKKVPVLYWLSGLSCTDQNFVTKAGAQQYAARYGIAIVAADTSPRGAEVADDADGNYDFGLGAGFYVNATQSPWARHYQMYDYIVDELPRLIEKNFPVDGSRCSISGHSMGGHGALTIALKNPGKFKSVSAFAPIYSPGSVPWGQKALNGYLGENSGQWDQYDACKLIATAGEKLPILIDQGDADEFLNVQLTPGLFALAARKANHPVELRMQQGYDHSYFFIASFIGEHMDFHARYLFE